MRKKSRPNHGDTDRYILIVCLPMAHWYVFRGDWLWCGYGIKPAQTPNNVNGAISTCVVSFSIWSSLIAIKLSFSSLTSKNSIKPTKCHTYKITRRPKLETPRTFTRTLTNEIFELFLPRFQFFDMMRRHQGSTVRHNYVRSERQSDRHWYTHVGIEPSSLTFTNLQRRPLSLLILMLRWSWFT